MWNSLSLNSSVNQTEILGTASPARPLFPLVANENWFTEKNVLATIRHYRGKIRFQALTRKVGGNKYYDLIFHYVRFDKLNRLFSFL